MRAPYFYLLPTVFLFGCNREPNTILNSVDVAERTSAPCQPVPLTYGFDAVTLFPGNCFWNCSYMEGKKIFIAPAWGGTGTYSAAESNLNHAGAAGAAEAAYCLLNFDNPAWNGAYQVDQALSAVGLESSLLSFMAIDVEASTAFNNSLTIKKSAQIIARIQEAVDRINAIGLKPVIYTTRNFWTKIVGDSKQFSAAGIPLWDATIDNVDQLCLTSATAWNGYGGWNVRAGHQYSQNKYLLGNQVDLDVFDESLLFFAQTPSPTFTYVWSASNLRTLSQDGWVPAFATTVPPVQTFVNDATFGNNLLQITDGYIEQIDPRLATLPMTVEFSAGVRFPTKGNAYAEFRWWGPSVHAIINLTKGSLQLYGAVDPLTGHSNNLVIPFNSSDAIHSYRMVIETSKRVSLYIDCSQTPIGTVDGTTAPGFDFNYINISAPPTVNVFAEHVSWAQSAMLTP